MDDQDDWSQHQNMSGDIDEESRQRDDTSYDAWDHEQDSFIIVTVTTTLAICTHYEWEEQIEG